MSNSKISVEDLTDLKHDNLPYVSCLESSPACPVCTSVIDENEIKALFDHTVPCERELKNEERVMFKLESGVDEQGSKSDPTENDPDRNESEGVYDSQAYLETLEDRAQRSTVRINELLDSNETLVDDLVNVRRVNIILRMQLCDFHKLQELTTAREDVFQEMLASISEQPNAVPQLVFYCTLLRRQLLEISRSGGPGTVIRPDVGRGNPGCPCCSNRGSEPSLERTELISQSASELSGETHSSDTVDDDVHENSNENAAENQF